MRGKKKERDIPALRELAKTSLEKIMKAVEQECGDKPNIKRKAAVYISHRFSGRTLREIGQRFGIGEYAVAQVSRRFETELARNRRLTKRIAHIHMALDL